MDLFLEILIRHLLKSWGAIPGHRAAQSADWQQVHYIMVDPERNFRHNEREPVSQSLDVPAVHMTGQEDTTMNMKFHMPTQVLMGPGCVRENAAVLASLGARALIVTGRSSRSNGALKDVTDTLDSNGQTWVIFNEVQSNPTIASVYAGAELARIERTDCVIGIGGGSPMDAAKAIALLASQDIPEDRLFSGSYGPSVLPMAMIPTTAGTGSEVTQYSVLTNDRLQTKTSIGSPVLFPSFALLDARYMLSLPPHITNHTAVDALAHAVEGMLTVNATPMTDMIALESIGWIASVFDALKTGRLELADRENLLYASMLAGIVVAHTKTTTVHAMGYSLTYFKNLDHGHATGLFLPEFLAFVEKSQPDQVRRILAAMNLTDVNAFRALMRTLLEMPDRLTPAEIDAYTAITARSKSVQNSTVVPAVEEIRQFYEAVTGG